VDIIGLVQGSGPEGVINGAVARPLLLGWDGMMWEPKRAMNSGSMNTQEARIPLLKQGECQDLWVVLLSWKREFTTAEFRSTFPSSSPNKVLHDMVKKGFLKRTGWGEVCG